MDFRNDINIESKLNEAEVCRNMGLHGDAVDIQRRDHVQQQIALLRKEIDNRGKVEPGSISDGDIDILIDGLPDPDDPEAIFDKASAFQEMGLYEQANVELLKLFEKDYPDQVAVAELVDNLLRLHSPSKAADEFTRLTEEQDLDDPKKAWVVFLFGQEMEQKDHREVALEMYKAAHQLDPADDDIKEALDSIAATFRKGSKYDYLLEENRVTADQLQKAFTL